MRTTHLQFTIPLGFTDDPLRLTVWTAHMESVDPFSATAALLSPLCFQFLQKIVRNSYILLFFKKPNLQITIQYIITSIIFMQVPYRRPVSL